MGDTEKKSILFCYDTKNYHIVNRITSRSEGSTVAVVITSLLSTFKDRSRHAIRDVTRNAPPCISLNTLCEEVYVLPFKAVSNDDNFMTHLKYSLIYLYNGCGLVERKKMGILKSCKDCCSSLVGILLWIYASVGLGRRYKSIRMSAEATNSSKDNSADDRLLTGH